MENEADEAGLKEEIRKEMAKEETRALNCCFSGSSAHPKGTGREGVEKAAPVNASAVENMDAS
eukprot:2814588-Amphidinium_carterae.1